MPDNCSTCGGPAEDHGLLNGYPDKHAFTIDMTPTWGALVPAMLAAYANMTRQYRADNLNMCHEDVGSGWCDVHDTTFSEDTDPARGCRIRSNTAKRGQWMLDLRRAINDTETEFRRMAEAADKWNAHAKEGSRS